MSAAKTAQPPVAIVVDECDGDRRAKIKSRIDS